MLKRERMLRARRIRNYYLEHGSTYAEIAEEFGVSADFVGRIVRNELYHDPNYEGRGPVEIMVYRGEQLLCVGTYKECAEQTGYTVSGLRDMKKPSHLERIEELGQPILITATRKYDRRKKEHRDKEQILTLYYNNKFEFEGTFEECMEHTGRDKAFLKKITGPRWHREVERMMKHSTTFNKMSVYRVED